MPGPGLLLNAGKSDRAATVPGKVRSFLLKYALPFLAIGLATCVSLLILRVLGQHPGIQITFWIALLASAWWGGYGPGVIASALSVYVVPYAFEPKFHPAPSDFTRFLLVSFLLLLVSYIAARGEKAERALRVMNEVLDERVRQRTAELQNSNAELQRANEALNQFAYSASHDLQEPLRMLAMYSQMLKRKYEGRLDAQASEFIGYIADGAARMEMLVAGLLSYTRVLNVEAEHVEPVDANVVAAHAISNLNAAIQESGVNVVCGPLPRLKMADVHLLQILQNLAGNAIKYRGKEAPRVEITAQKRENNCIICVADNGIGIPPQYAHQIFRIFKRLHSSREYAGTGIGLALCQRIVEHYGGRIWVESEQGKGSKFFFSIPDEQQGQPSQLPNVSRGFLPSIRKGAGNFL